MKKINNFKYSKSLAPYAMRDEETKGRKFKEPEHPYRFQYQRDRERIVHANAFRRLEYKTQVFVNHEGDYFRTRLTHTLEVAQIGRTIARALGLNEDLVEAIALAHDLGHTPFGHSGEEVLNEIMKDHGGFDHNLQSLRVVDYLEERYPDFKGLNLTWEVRAGIARHNTSYDAPPSITEFTTKESPSLETQVVDVADEIAYDSHDLDDGLTSKILSEIKLEKVPIWEEVNNKITKKYGNIHSALRRYQAVKELISLCVNDLIENSTKLINEFNIKSSQDACNCPRRLIEFSKTIESKRQTLRQYLFDNLYKNYRVIRMANKAKRFTRELFEIYTNDPAILPPYYLKKVAKGDSPHAIVCDYIAGMTDRYALDEYKKLFDPYERV
ncbi:MAG: deoxyguanosinetriphosphate triphosphohydrolase [Candidatus Omnitrophota bacterium]